MKENDYLKAIDILHQFAHAPLNENQPGGIPWQKDQLYGLAVQVFRQMAHDNIDSTFNGLINLLRKARNNE